MAREKHGRRFTPANLTIFRDRFSRRISDQGVPHALAGVEVTDARLGDGTIIQCAMLGPILANKSPDVKSLAIALDTDEGKAPFIHDDGRVLHGHIEEKEGSFKLVRGHAPGEIHTRIFMTGLERPREALSRREMRGFRQKRLQELSKEGVKLGYHGIFPLAKGSAHVVAEGRAVEVLEQAAVMDLTDDAIRNFPGLEVPESRDMAAAIPIGGAVICGDLGFLTIHERPGKYKWDLWDVTDDPSMWKLYQQLIHEEWARRNEERKKVEAAAAEAREAKKTAQKPRTDQDKKPEPSVEPNHKGGIELGSKS